MTTNTMPFPRASSSSRLTASPRAVLASLASNLFKSLLLSLLWCILSSHGSSCTVLVSPRDLNVSSIASPRFLFFSMSSIPPLGHPVFLNTSSSVFLDFLDIFNPPKSMSCFQDSPLPVFLARPRMSLLQFLMELVVSEGLLSFVLNSRFFCKFRALCNLFRNYKRSLRLRIWQARARVLHYHQPW